MSYIEREKLLAELQKKIDLSHNAKRAVIEEDFEDIINDMPDADVVEVVRCKDCKNLMFSDFYGECSKGYMGIVSPDDYCSRGERKDGE